MDLDEKRARQREAQRRFRQRQKEAGVKRVTSDAEKARQREYARAKREAAKASGAELPADTWWKRNIEKHREKTRRWRAENIEHAREVTRKNQAKRRSTPWGAINNRIWPVMHSAVRANSDRPGMYNYYLGYLWSALRAHLEALFTPEMSWENWGEIWEVDHITPVSSFKYESLADPLFRECWQLGNLRPLLRGENAAKGSKF